MPERYRNFTIRLLPRHGFNDFYVVDDGLELGKGILQHPSLSLSEKNSTLVNIYWETVPKREQCLLYECKFPIFISVGEFRDLVEAELVRLDLLKVYNCYIYVGILMIFKKFP